MCREVISLLDQERQVSQLAVLHHQVNMHGSLDTFVQGDNVGMAELLENPDLGVEVVFHFAFELTKFDRLDSNDRTGRLRGERESVCDKQTKDNASLRQLWQRLSSPWTQSPRCSRMCPVFILQDMQKLDRR